MNADAGTAAPDATICVRCRQPIAQHPIDIDGPGAGQQVLCITPTPPPPPPPKCPNCGTQGWGWVRCSRCEPAGTAALRAENARLREQVKWQNQAIAAWEDDDRYTAELESRAEALAAENAALREQVGPLCHRIVGESIERLEVQVVGVSLGDIYHSVVVRAVDLMNVLSAARAARREGGANG